MNINNKKLFIRIITVIIIIVIILIISFILKLTNISKFENKQKIHFITYGDDKVNCKTRIIPEAENFGIFDSIKFYEPKDISEEFYNKHKNVLEQKRGGGYWIWKYDIILQKLNEINDNDILVYIDCGCTINKDGKDKFYEYINMLNESPYGIISFQTDNIERIWTTKELFKFLDIDLESDIAKSGQYIGGILIMKKSEHLLNILNKCIEIIDKDNNLITDLYNTNQEHYFKENRHDQSILSLVRKKNNSIVISYYNESTKLPFIASRKR